MIGFSIMMWFIGFVLCMVSISLLRGNTSSMHGKVIEETYDKTGYAKSSGKITLFMGAGIIVCGFAALIGTYDAGMGYATALLLIIVIIAAYWFYKVQIRFSMKSIFLYTEVPDFQRVAFGKFGAEQGEHIYNDAVTKLKGYMAEADYRGSKAVKKHMFTNILPQIAIYKSCMENGVSQEDAYNFSLELSQIGAQKKQIMNSKLTRIPFLYSLFKLFCKHVMSTQYPEAGWDLEWKSYDKKEVHFDITRCVYADKTAEYGCLELCTVFCANDDTVFKGYSPRIVFERSGTLARGMEKCDFHYRNGAK